MSFWPGAALQLPLQDVLWDSVPSVSRAQLDSSLGRFSVDKASSIIVRAQTQYNTFTGECALADKWYRTAAEQVAAQGIDKSQYTIRCVHVCGCGCVEAVVVEGGGRVCVCSSWTLSVMAPSWLCQPARATTVAPRLPCF